MNIKIAVLSLLAIVFLLLSAVLYLDYELGAFKKEAIERGHAVDCGGEFRWLGDCDG